MKYEGLVYGNKNVVSELSGTIKFLEDNSYELGYASFWNSNVLTELTDGDVKMINVNISDDSISYYDWLTLKSYRTIASENAFVLIRKSEEIQFADNVMKNINFKNVYEDEYYIIYDIINHNDFITELNNIS